jgi:hypothetical protein
MRVRAQIVMSAEPYCSSARPWGLKSLPAERTSSDSGNRPVEARSDEPSTLHFAVSMINWNTFVMVGNGASCRPALRDHLLWVDCGVSKVLPADFAKVKQYDVIFPQACLPAVHAASPPSHQQALGECRYGTAELPQALPPMRLRHRPSRQRTPLFHEGPSR